MRIIPAIDIIGAECVRLTEGDFETKRAYGDPVHIARRFIEAGARLLQVVDLEGAKAGRVTNWPTLKAIVALNGVELQVGGGIRTTEDAERLFELGVTRVIVGSVAVASPQLLAQWVARFGAGRFCVAVDVKRGALLSNGWLAREQASFEDVVAQTEKLGIREYLCTDVARDGTLAGPNVDLYKHLVAQFPLLRWIAAGGVRSRDDLTALQEIGVHAVVLGTALLDGKLKLEELREFS